MSTFNTQARTAWANIKMTNKRTGTDLPKALVKAWDELDALAAQRLPLHYDRAALVEAVAAAVTEGRDLMDDPAVTRQLMARLLDDANPSSLVGAHVDTQRAALLAKHTPALVKAWAAVVSAADETLRNARSAGLDLSQTITDSTPPTALAMLGAAREARDNVVAIAGAWHALMESTGQARPVGRQALIVAPLTRREYLALGHRPSAQAVIESGAHRLQLATADEFAARVKALEEDQRAETAQAARDLTNAAGKSLRFNAPAAS